MAKQGINRRGCRGDRGDTAEGVFLRVLCENLCALCGENALSIIY